MVSASRAFPGRPFNLRVEAWVISQDTNPAAPASLCGWQVWIDKTSYSPTWSAGGHAVRILHIDGVERGIDTTPGFDFRAGGPWLVLSGQNWIAHNSDGTKTSEFHAYADYEMLGATDIGVNLTMPPIAVYGPPNPPINGYIDNIAKTSFDYHFTDGGGVVTSYAARYATREDMSDAVQIPAPLSGFVPISGLKPGTTYYVESRSGNDRGVSAWGARASARTRSGAWISDGTKWIPADVFISDGTNWKPADVLISDGTSWKPTA